MSFLDVHRLAAPAPPVPDRPRHLSYSVTL